MALHSLCPYSFQFPALNEGRCHFYVTSMSFHPLTLMLYRASDISRKKKQNFAGFSGANSRKNRPISRDFCGENKSKFAKK